MNKDPETRLSRSPEAVATPRSRWRVQLVWLVPLIAVLIGGWLAVQGASSKGADHHHQLSIPVKGWKRARPRSSSRTWISGWSRKSTLSRDHKPVIATAEVVKDASDLLVDDTRFWVVRPRISGGTVSGMGTLLSGSFVGMDVGGLAARRGAISSDSSHRL